MGVSKTNLFSIQQNELAQLAKALSHPARVAIVEYLLQANTCINGDLVKELGLAQATVSQHLKELKSVGIIQGSIDGNRMCYCIDPIRWKEIQLQFNALFAQLKSSCESGSC